MPPRTAFDHYTPREAEEDEYDAEYEYQTRLSLSTLLGEVERALYGEEGVEASSSVADHIAEAQLWSRARPQLRACGRQLGQQEVLSCDKEQGWCHSSSQRRVKLEAEWAAHCGSDDADTRHSDDISGYAETLQRTRARPMSVLACATLHTPVEPASLVIQGTKYPSGLPTSAAAAADACAPEAMGGPGTHTEAVSPAHTPRIVGSWQTKECVEEIIASHGVFQEIIATHRSDPSPYPGGASEAFSMAWRSEKKRHSDVDAANFRQVQLAAQLSLPPRSPRLAIGYNVISSIVDKCRDALMPLLSLLPELVAQALLARTLGEPSEERRISLPPERREREWGPGASRCVDTTSHCDAARSMEGDFALRVGADRDDEVSAPKSASISYLPLQRSPLCAISAPRHSLPPIRGPALQLRSPLSPRMSIPPVLMRSVTAPLVPPISAEYVGSFAGSCIGQAFPAHRNGHYSAPSSSQSSRRVGERTLAMLVTGSPATRPLPVRGLSHLSSGKRLDSMTRRLNRSQSGSTDGSPLPVGLVMPALGYREDTRQWPMRWQLSSGLPNEIRGGTAPPSARGLAKGTSASPARSAYPSTRNSNGRPGAHSRPQPRGGKATRDGLQPVSSSITGLNHQLHLDPLCCTPGFVSSSTGIGAGSRRKSDVAAYRVRKGPDAQARTRLSRLSAR